MPKLNVPKKCAYCGESTTKKDYNIEYITDCNRKVPCFEHKNCKFKSVK